MLVHLSAMRVLSVLVALCAFSRDVLGLKARNATGVMGPSRGPLRINKFVVVSAPRRALVSYLQVNGNGQTHPLIDRGLRTPQGLAVDERRRRLYVADPGSRKVYGYTILFQNGWLMTDGVQDIVLQNIEARWLAVDQAGTLFATDEGANTVLTVPVGRLARAQLPAIPEVLYSGLDIHLVSSPGGIAADNFNVFWTNKVMGDAVGSVVKGFERPAEQGAAGLDAVRILARNAVRSYGLCLSASNVYYTAPDHMIFGVKKVAGSISVVTDRLQKPRGCAWDSDGTVFVADKGAGRIVSFPANMQEIGAAQISHVADYEDAFGMAVMSASARGVPSPMLAFGAVLMVVFRR